MSHLWELVGVQEAWLLLLCIWLRSAVSSASIHVTILGEEISLKED